MEHAAHSICERLQLGERVFQRVALMDYAVKPKFRGDFQMLAKQVRLFVFVTLVIDRTELRLLARQSMVIQPRLTNRRHAWMPRQLAQRRHDVFVFDFFDIARMHAGDRRDV